MKVLLINGSPRATGCTYIALNEVAKTLNEQDIETEIIQVGHKEYSGCLSCYSCYKTRQCVIDDEVNEIASRFLEYSGIVIGSPVYYAAPSGALLSFLNRLFYRGGTDKTMIVGAAVVSARRAGCTATFDVLNKYFTISGMPVVSSQYWNMVHGSEAEEVLEDLEGLQTMRVLARNMAFLMKSIKLGKETYGLPEKEKRVFTNFTR